MSIVDWPQFRGPNSDGRAGEAAIPTEWSESKNIAWKVPIEGLGWSSPVVVEGRVFLTTAITKGETLSLRAIALDAASGTTIWERELRSVTPVPHIHAKNSHASPTPIVRDGMVYVHFGTLGTAQLRAKDGEIVWQNQELLYPPMHGSGGSPMLHEGKLVMVCDGSEHPFVVALDANTGKIAWRQSRSVDAKISHSFATTSIAISEGRALVIAPGPNHLAAYDLHTGEERWKVLAQGWSVVPQPALGKGLVVYNHDYDNPELIAVKLGGLGDVTGSHIAWRVRKGAPSTPSPLLIDDYLFIVSDDGVASCLDLMTGKAHWMERLGGNFSASPLFIDGKVLFLDEDGVSHWVACSPEFQRLGKNELPGRTLATPAVSGKGLYLRTDTHLYKIASALTDVDGDIGR